MNLNALMGAGLGPNGRTQLRSYSNLSTHPLYTPRTPQRMGAPLVLRAHTAELNGSEWERMSALGSTP